MELDHKIDETAFKEYYVANKDAIYVFAYKRCKNKEDAEDVTAKTFQKFWENRNSLENPAHVVSFLYKVARNATTDIFRSRRHAIAAQKELIGLQNQSLDNSDLAICKEETLSRLTAEVQKIPERMQEALILTHLMKLTAAQVSELMGIRSATVYTFTQRALHRLRLSMIDHGLEKIAISIVFLLATFS